MTSADTNPDAFHALVSHGLITDAQHDAALAHPEARALPPIPGPAHALAWMRLKNLITEEELDAAVERLEAASPAVAAFTEAEDIAYDADDLLDLGKTGITHEAVIALFNEGLIDTETRDLALRAAPLTGAPAALGPTLGWLVTDGLLDTEPFEALRARVAAEPAFATAADHRRILDEAQAIVAADAQETADMLKEFARSQQTSWRNFGMIVVAVVIVIGWYLFGR